MLMFIIEVQRRLDISSKQCFYMDPCTKLFFLLEHVEELCIIILGETLHITVTVLILICCKDKEITGVSIQVSIK
jgi:hypothetical protein